MTHILTKLRVHFVPSHPIPGPFLEVTTVNNLTCIFPDDLYAFTSVYV